MTNTDISNSNGAETLTVSASSPFMDLLDHMLDSSTDPLDLIDSLAGYRNYLEEAVGIAVARARESGDSWDAVGSALGTSRQAAHERYGS